MRSGLYAILNLPHPSGLDPLRVTALLLERRPAEDPLAALQLRWKQASSERRAALLDAYVDVLDPEDMGLEERLFGTRTGEVSVHFQAFNQIFSN